MTTHTFPCSNCRSSVVVDDDLVGADAVSALSRGLTSIQCPACSGPEQAAAADGHTYRVEVYVWRMDSDDELVRVGVEVEASSLASIGVAGVSEMAIQAVQKLPPGLLAAAEQDL